MTRALRILLAIAGVAVLLPVGVVHWQALLRGEPGSAGAPHLERAERAMSEGRYVDALVAYGHARELSPQDPAVHLGLMKARVALAAAEPGRIGAEAVPDICYEASYLLDVDPAGRVTWLTGLGNALWVDGRIAEARAALEEAVAADPASPHAHTGLGLVLLRLPDRRGAGRAELDTAIGVKPDHMPALLPLAQIALADGDRPRALELARRVLEVRDDKTARDIVAAATASVATTGATPGTPPGAPQQAKARPAPPPDAAPPQARPLARPEPQKAPGPKAAPDAG